MTKIKPVEISVFQAHFHGFQQRHTASDLPESFRVSLHQKSPHGQSRRWFPGFFILFFCSYIPGFQITPPAVATVLTLAAAAQTLANPGPH